MTGGRIPSHSTFRALSRVTALIGVTVFMLPFYLLCPPSFGEARRFLERTWFGFGCRLTGLRVRTVGRPSRTPSTLYVSNHVSYLDVPVLGRVLASRFVAKAEVANWPVLGFLARISRTAFISRNAMHALKQCADLTRRLAQESLILFAEGTSTSGKDVAPFKTSLFSIAKSGPAPVDRPVQPVSIAYLRLANGQPLSGGLEDLYAWYGEMDLVPHLWTVLGIDGAMVEVCFHDPVTSGGFNNRKDIASYCEGTIRAGLAASRETDGRGTPMGAIRQRRSFQSPLSDPAGNDLAGLCPPRNHPEKKAGAMHRP